MSEDNIPIKHNILSDDDVKACLSYDSGTRRHVALEADGLHRWTCLVLEENSAHCIPIRHNVLSDDDVKVCLSYDNGTKRHVAMEAGSRV